MSGHVLSSFNPIALRMAKTLWSFGRSECSRIKNLVIAVGHSIVSLVKSLVSDLLILLVLIFQ